MPSCFDAIFSDKSLKPLELSKVRRTGKPNDALFADEIDVTCRTDEKAVIVTGKTMNEVHAAVRSYAIDEKDGKERELDATSGLYVIRTPFFRFPDGLYYWLEPIDGGTKLSMYSRAVYGYGDQGVNRGHIESCIQKCGASVGKKDT